VGVDSNDVYVLRDTAYTAVETPKTEVPGASGMQVRMTSGGCEVIYSIASECRVDLAVYDLTGREVRRLVAETQSAGQHKVDWDRRDSNGSAVPPSVYFIRETQAQAQAVRKVVIAN
jgi:flagellar hook assembly protein FlgD